MTPLAILLAGMLIVLGAILVLRLHAFLALILAAFAVAALTPKDAVYEYGIWSKGVVLGEDLQPEGKRRAIAGEAQIFRGGGDGRLVEVGTEGEVEARPGDLRVHHTQVAEAKATAGRSFAARVADGFGETCLGIGILIAMASIVGKTLMDSGAAERIVLGLRNLFGEKRAPMAFTGGGFVLGIPVFFDTVFYLLMPLGKAMYVRTGRDYLLYVLTIVAGGTMAHSLVPPTPGPLFVADELGVELGVMILGGCAVGLFTVTAGYLFAHYANRRWEIPLRESVELSREELEAMSERGEKDLPGLFVSLLPILLPLVLLSGSAVVGALVDLQSAPGLKAALGVLGDKNVALTLAAVAGLALVWRRGKSREEIAKSVQTALAGGGVIILITAAGGAFGYVLRQTGIALTIQDGMGEASMALLPLAFLICAIIRTAQGSATVAMITAAGIMAPIAAAGVLTFHPVYLALAIGCGSKPISWMNDSGFWVMSQVSGLTEAEMLKTVTVMSALMALVGLLVCMLGAAVLPLV